MHTSQPDDVRIVHISDLHFGRNFNWEMWRELQRAVTGIRPHCIIVTGDLVNSPFWWSLHRAYRELISLRDRTRTAAGNATNLLVIAGNHDTRMLGILPVVWIAPSLIVISAIAGSISFANWHEYALRIIAGIAIGILALRFICLRRFTSYFRSLIPQLPDWLPELGLVLYPFDSATHAVFAAGGVIPLRQFTAARAEASGTVPSEETAIEERRRPPFRLALLHHHTLPIPYDSARETMMVLKNAGAFLSEASRLGIRLAINGHKHHHHFSRVTINVESGRDESELSVLSTGTPTAGRQPDPFGYNFNLLEIDQWGYARVTRYHAEGGTFLSSEPFWVENVEATGKALFRENVQLKKCRCDSLAVEVNIDPDGDGRRDHYYRGFRFVGEGGIDALPGEIIVSLGSGHIERLEVRGESGSSRREPHFEAIELTPRLQRGRIALPERMTARDPVIDFSWGYDAINTFAMSEEQFRRMYPRGSSLPLEYVEFTPRYVPVGEVIIQVNLPQGFLVEAAPHLEVIDPSGAHNVRLEQAYQGNLVFNRSTNMLFVRMAYPPLNSCYRVQWRLSKKPPPAGRAVQSLAGQAKEVSDKLLDLVNSNRPSDGLVTLLESIEDEAREEFKLRPRDEDPLGLSIMVFDEVTGKLRIAAASYGRDDPRWNLAIDYGDGIAGRAYKMNRSRLFVKARAVANGTPFYCVTYDNRALSPDGREVPEEAILSMPLSHPEQSESVFRNTQHQFA